MEFFYLFAGITILLITSFDFFYTTLSGSGAFFLTRNIYKLLHKGQLILFRVFGRRVFKLSGIIINLGILGVWIMLVWLSLFLIYSFNPDAIMNGEEEVATTAERIYFTGYTLSTLGMGNFNPATPLFQVLTSLFSFFGFVFLSTSITYLVSVFSGVMHKRSLSLMLTRLGKDPAEVTKRFVDQDSAFTYQQILAIQRMIDQHSASYQAYPVLHYYINSDQESSLSIHLAILDESLSILFTSSKEYSFTDELIPLRSSINDFLKHLQQKFTLKKKAEECVRIDWSKLELPEGSLQLEIDQDDLIHRRKVLDGLLATEGFSWESVYPKDVVNT
jgi:hypothetical protein